MFFVGLMDVMVVVIQRRVPSDMRMGIRPSEEAGQHQKEGNEIRLDHQGTKYQENSCFEIFVYGLMIL